MISVRGFPYLQFVFAVSALICALFSLNCSTIESGKSTTIGCGSIIKQTEIKIKSGEFTLINGELFASERIIIISGDSFDGKGLLDAPEIEIVASEFNFKGTINCSKLCTITVKNSFDQNMFTRLGSGKFTINVDPDRFKKPCDGAKDKASLSQANQAQSTKIAASEPASRKVIKYIDVGNQKIDFSTSDPLSKKIMESIEADDFDGLTKLCIAFKERSKDNKFLEKDLTQFMTFAGATGHIQAAKTLLDFGACANQDEKSFYWQAPLLFAIKANQLAFVKLLLDHGANPNLKIKPTLDKNHGSKPFMVRIEDEKPIPLITFLAMQNRLEALGELLKAKNLEIDAVTCYDRTALMLAAYHGHKEVVEALLLAGADRNKVDSPRKSDGSFNINNRCNAADYARHGGHPEVVKLLQMDVAKMRIYAENDKSMPGKAKNFIELMKEHELDIELGLGFVCLGIVVIGVMVVANRFAPKPYHSSS